MFTQDELRTILEETRHEAVSQSDPSNFRKVTDGKWKGKQMRGIDNAVATIEAIITQQNKAAVAAFAEELKGKMPSHIDNWADVPNGAVGGLPTYAKSLVYRKGFNEARAQAISAITEALTPQPIKQRRDRSETI